MRRRLLLLVAVVVALLAVSAPVASAAAPPDQPVHGTWYASDTFDTGLCSAPVYNTYQEWFRFTDRFLKDGTIEEVGQVTELDVYTGNGRTLQSARYSWDYKTHASDLDFTTVYSSVATGTFMSFKLPDGTKILSAGRVDLTNVTGPFFAPDSGHAPDLAALCAYFFN